MINHLSQHNSNTSFGASVILNRQLILKNISKDKKITSEDLSSISKLLDKIDSFSKMKEDSIVKVSTLVDSYQTKLICEVYDKTKKFFEPITQRMAKMLAQDNNYRKQHINNMRMLIKNVAITRKSIDKITETINKSKNTHFDLKNIQECFEKSSFTSFFTAALNKNYNPTKRIINFIKTVDKGIKNGTEINLNIINKKGKKNKNLHSFLILSFKNGDKIEEKRVLLSELFKKPLEHKLIQK